MSDDSAEYEYDYNCVNRLVVQVTVPDGTVQKNVYDRAGRLVCRTDGMNTGIEYTYNFGQMNEDRRNREMPWRGSSKPSAEPVVKPSGCDFDPYL